MIDSNSADSVNASIEKTFFLFYEIKDLVDFLMIFYAPTLTELASQSITPLLIITCSLQKASSICSYVNDWSHVIG